MRRNSTTTMRRNTTSISDIVNISNIIGGVMFGCFMIGMIGIGILFH